MQDKPVFKVIFVNQDEVFEVFAAKIFQSELWGFIEIEEFLFGERSQLLVDPSEEKLKSEFAGVKRSYIPMQSIIRIDEVEKEGTVKVSEAKGGTVSAFPLSAPPTKPSN
ncbi:DUF1820 family protein [Litoribacillus peritrichatus]|uniref:DUF1820 family protein n=1 Tax=Litoribacillus peritrichatus TaxID=718191 RepID=A0ABP7NBU3_9GAMM